MSVKVFHFTSINFLRLAEILQFILRMKHKVLPEISHIFYAKYLQELKTRYSGIPLLMINTLGICEILHWYLCYEHNICCAHIYEKTTRIELELSHISYRLSQKTWEFRDELDIVFVMNKIII